MGGKGWVQIGSRTHSPPLSACRRRARRTSHVWEGEKGRGRRKLVARGRKAVYRLRQGEVGEGEPGAKRELRQARQGAWGHGESEEALFSYNFSREP